MNDSNNLLILNLGIDTNDTSLGFTQTWIEALSKEYSTTEIDPQGVDYAKLTPLLTAALQEAITKIETLEAEVAALKG